MGAYWQRALSDFNCETHRPPSNGALNIIRAPNAHTLSLAQVPREIGRRDALEEALLLLLDDGATAA